MLEGNAPTWNITQGFENGDYGGVGFDYWEIEGCINHHCYVFRSEDEEDAVWLQNILNGLGLEHKPIENSITK
jgi:hypothetical protein